VGGVPGIQADRSHEALDDPPHAIPSEASALAGEQERRVRDILATILLPGDERLEVALQVLRDEHLAGLVALSVAHKEGSLPIP
jgi:hypothetical protein